jgi:hypothetical protein
VLVSWFCAYNFTQLLSPPQSPQTSIIIGVCGDIIIGLIIQTATNMEIDTILYDAASDVSHLN